MSTQSLAPQLLLTRPQAQSQRFADQLQQALGPLQIIISPLMVPSFAAVDLQDRHYTAIILTSETGALAAGRISAMGQALPHHAFCVGDRTAAAARDAGFSAISAKGDARDLIQLIQSSHLDGPLLHLCGADTRGDIAKILTKGGLETVAQVVYSQNPVPFSPQAQRVLAQDAPLILPIFSPRTALLLAKALPADRKSPLWVAAISPAAAQAAQRFGPERLMVAARPDAPSLLHAVTELISLATGA